MTAITEAIARLARRQIVDRFRSEAADAMLRVTCLERAEIVALVESLRAWKPADVEIAVTTSGPWPELSSDEIVPRPGCSPTTLRNRQVGVVLIEGDDYTDRQSWISVRAVSDASLVVAEEGRTELIRYALRDPPPRIALDVLEEVYESVTQNDGFVNVRLWIAFVLDACGRLDLSAPVDTCTMWRAVGQALPKARLFPDDALADLPPTDRRRRLRQNQVDSYRLFFEADDRWRDTLQERIAATEFFDESGKQVANATSIRTGLERLLGASPDAEQQNVLFRNWLSLIGTKRKRLGLGSRLRDSVGRAAPDRVREFDELDVAEGIDAGIAEDAQKLLEATPPRDELIPLVRLLTSNQVSAIERMANPRALATLTPYAELLRVVADMVSERAALLEGAELATQVSLSISPRKVVDEAIHSRGLFAWLFGPTLRGLVESLQDESTTITVDPQLTDLSVLGTFNHDTPRTEDDSENEGSFETLELRLSWSDGAGRERRIDWSPKDTPGLVALWRLCCRPEVHTWAPSADMGFDAWLGSATQQLEMSGAQSQPDDPPTVVSQWLAIRNEALAEIGRSGLALDVLDRYIDDYRGVLIELREKYVPSGAPRTEVATVLEGDVCLGDRGVMLLATHPIRLRWISAYLARLSGLMLRAVRGELQTNPINPDLFFSQLLTASPQAQPPVLVANERLCVATREKDWHEVFAALKDERGERRDWLADLDDGAIDDVADTVKRYLDAYPHKADGLHLLCIIRRNGARGLHRLVSNVRRRIKVSGASLELTLCVPADEIREVEEVLQDFDDSDHRALSDRPPVRVVVRPWSDPEGTLPDLEGVEPVVDVAVIPNLFGASTRTNDATRDGRLDTGSFDPLFDEPTRLEPVGSGDTPSAAVSRVMLPTGRDQLLEVWSTVTTRQFRGSTISEAPTEHDIDHVTIQVSLEKNRAFFDALHVCAHWVVTVDAFVGREQIEALTDGPDVIRVKTGVGANGAYRMVVSSKAGRAFVESRVARRLREQVSADALSSPDKLASAIYDRARLLVPGIVLRSVGLGRTAAEMVGLVLARARLEQLEPAKVGPHGFQTWLSLDEHPEWSGGHQSPRADLARIRGWFDGKTLRLCVDVVEAKMRTQVAVGRAERQLDRSCELLRAALTRSTVENGSEVGYADAPMWRRLIWRAIEQTSMAADATPAATHVVDREGRRSTLGDELRAALRQGDIVVESVAGVLVSLRAGSETSDSSTPGGHRWLRMTLDEVKQELDRLCLAPVYPISDRKTQTPSSGGNAPSGPPAGTRDTPPLPPTLADLGSAASRLDATPIPPERGRSPGRRGGRSDRALRRMQDLLDALHARNVEASPEGTDSDALEGPGFYLLRIRLGRAFRPQHVTALSEDIQYYMGLEAGQTPRIYVDRGAVVVEIPKPDEERYYVDAEELWSRTQWPKDRLYAVIGADVSDKPVGVDFSSSRSPHLLIGGMTGGGKSVALETLLLGLVRHYPPSALELRLVDPKGNELAHLEDLEHVPNKLATKPGEAIEILEGACDEMDRRYGQMQALSRERKIAVRNISTYNEAVAPAERFKWIVVVLDEFSDLTSDKDNKKAIEALLLRLAQKARASGIHVIVATQKPSAEVISTTTRSNLGAQLALRVRGASDSRVIMEAMGAESLAGNGDAFLRLSGSEPVRLQCARYEEA